MGLRKCPGASGAQNTASRPVYSNHSKATGGADPGMSFAADRAMRGSRAVVFKVADPAYFPLGVPGT